MDDFFEVWDANGTYGFFQNRELAEKCAGYWEKKNYPDEPDKVHIYIYVRSFDDPYWM